MNEYSRELMHMTTSEKADYNRRYYQRNKQYWKDYYKTGHGNGRGRSTAVTSGTRNDRGHSGGGSYWRTDNGTSNSRGHGGGGSSFNRNHSGGGSSFNRNHSGGGSSFKRSHSGGGSSWDLSGSQAIKWDRRNENATRKWKTYTGDGRPQYNYSRDNASHWRNTRNSGKSLDNINDDRVREAMKNWEDREAESWWDDDRMKNARTHGAYGDYATAMEERNRRQDTMRTIRPRTVNIPTRTIDRAKAAMKEFFMVGVPEIAKELPKRGIQSAKKFLKNLGIL